MITNYGELQEKVKDWLNRSDLDERVPTYISIGEKKIFRKLRIQENEAVVTVNTVADSGVLAVPSDYQEMINVRCGPDTLVRVDSSQLLRMQGQGVREKPCYFSRVGSEIRLYPIPDDAYECTIHYFQDLSGSLVNDADTNPVLLHAPDLYLYAALIQAEPMLQTEQDNSMAVWKSLYEESMMELNEEYFVENHSGSTMNLGRAYENGTYQEPA